MLNLEKVIEFNRELTGHGTILNKNSLHSAFSSYHYYDNISEQIVSIFRGLIKNHPFSDGNKRTAISVLLALFELNNIPMTKSDDELFEIILKVATQKLEIEEIVKLFE